MLLIRSRKTTQKLFFLRKVSEKYMRVGYSVNSGITGEIRLALLPRLCCVAGEKVQIK